MRKVRVKREMPFGKVGEIWESDNGYYGYLGYGVDSVKKMIQDGWLEEVMEEKSLADKMKEANFNKIIDYDLLAKIAMEHAAEVVKKAILELKDINSDLDTGYIYTYFLKALKQESELNKTKEG